MGLAYRIKYFHMVGTHGSIISVTLLFQICCRFDNLCAILKFLFDMKREEFEETVPKPILSKLKGLLGSEEKLTLSLETSRAK